MSRLKQTMLAKPQDLMDSYVKNSEVVMLFKIFAENKPRDFFEEKWERLMNKNIVEIQAFNLKSLFYGSKRNNRVKLNTNEAIALS